MSYDRYHPPIAVNQIRRDIETCRYFIVVEIKTVNEVDTCLIKYLDNGDTRWYHAYSVSMVNSIIVEEE